MGNGGYDDVHMQGWICKRDGIMMCKLKWWMDKGGHYDVQIKGWMQKGVL